MAFPATRMRRLRKTGVLRGLVRETELSVSHLVYPMFVVAGGERRRPIPSLPGIDHLSIDGAVEEAGIAHDLGIPAVLLFGLPAAKDELGSGAWDEEGVVQLATRAIKAAHPDLLVTTQWLSEHLDDPGLVVVESDEDVLLYDTGHIPGAVKIDWHTDLPHPLNRDYLDEDAFARLMRDKGIGPDTTVVFYGDKNNWWATYALWVFQLFGHDQVKVMDGGRKKWDDEGRPMSTDYPSYPPTEYPVPRRDD